MQFPLRLSVTKVVPQNDVLLEVAYDVIDAAGAVVKHDYFLCKPLDVEEVCAYTLERYSLACAQPSRPAALDRVSFDGDSAKVLSSARAPTQTISPPGVGVPTKAGK